MVRARPMREGEREGGLLRETNLMEPGARRAEAEKEKVRFIGKEGKDCRKKNPRELWVMMSVL